MKRAWLALVLLPALLIGCSDPKPTTQERLPLRSRKPTARSRFAMSGHNARTAASFSTPGLTVTTRKIAAGVRPKVTS